jgi:hypothetical protein
LSETEQVFVRVTFDVTGLCMRETGVTDMPEKRIAVGDSKGAGGLSAKTAAGSVRLEKSCCPLHGADTNSQR